MECGVTGDLGIVRQTMDINTGSGSVTILLLEIMDFLALVLVKTPNFAKVILILM